MTPMPFLLLALATIVGGGGTHHQAEAQQELSSPPSCFYVSSSTGDDARSGTDPAAAWKTLRRVNSAAIEPGSCVLFARGDVWRGALVASTGNATHTTRYGSYGRPSLPRPLFLGSLAASEAADWTDRGAGVWAVAMLLMVAWAVSQVCLHGPLAIPFSITAIWR